MFPRELLALFGAAGAEPGDARWGGAFRAENSAGVRAFASNQRNADYTAKWIPLHIGTQGGPMRRSTRSCDAIVSCIASVLNRSDPLFRGLSGFLTPRFAGPSRGVVVLAVSTCAAPHPSVSMVWATSVAECRPVARYAVDLRRWCFAAQCRVESWREQHQVAEEVDVLGAARLRLDVLDRVRC